MSWNARRAFFVLLALTVATSAFWLDRGSAQDKAKGVPIRQLPVIQPPRGPGMNPDGFLNNGISLPKDEKGRGKAIEAASDYIENGDWDIAIPRLQKLLEIDEDVFVRLKRKNAEGKEVLVWVSVKKEADRLIGTLPAAGLEFYKASYNTPAADLLKKAKQNGDPSLLAEVMKRFAHTDAGGEAIKMLADYHLDRGNRIAANLCYNKLLRRQGADKLPPEVIAKAAAAAALAGNAPNAKELWKQVHDLTRELKFGEQSISVEDFEDYVAKLPRRGFDANATDSTVFRATPQRANQLVGGPAFMSAKWRQTMMYDKDNAAAVKSLDDAEAALRRVNRPIIPAFSPITATVSKGETKQSLLIYKNYWGIVARDLKDPNGEIVWASPSSWSLEKMLESKADQRRQSAMTGWLSFFHGQYPQILFENSTVGTLSTDGRFVYVVEDLAVPPATTNPNPNVWNGGMNNQNSGYGQDVQDAIAHSHLQIFDLKSGKLVDEMPRPGEEKGGPLADCYFLGPPLPLGGKLYTLTEKQQELRLVCFEMVQQGVDPLSGKPLYGARVASTQTLGATQEKLQDDVIRRSTAAHLAYGEGILVCPTNAGAVFGINLLENSLVWAYPYREKSDMPQPQMQPGARFPGRARGGMVWNGNNVQANLQAHINHWKASAPVLADGKVVFTAPDARSLHCVNLRDGSPVWRKPKLDDDLYLGNVVNGKVLIVGKESVRGLSLATGETLWKLDTGTPTGQGIGSDGIYYLPLQAGGRNKKPQIVAIDMGKGRIIPGAEAQPRTPGREDYDVPGNLLFHDGEVISLTHKEIVVYPQLKAKLAEMDELIAKNPNDPIGLTARGELRLSRNDLAGAIEDLSTALKNKPNKETRDRARSKLYDTLTVYITDHFNDAEKYLKEYEELCQVDWKDAAADKQADLQAEQRRRRSTFLWLVGKGREEQGRLVEAFEKYQQFSAEAGTQQELVPAVDDRSVKAAPDVWSRGRIIAMMSKAAPENRAPLEKLIADKWDKLRQTNDLHELRQFVRLFGSVSVAGKEARLQLVDRLMEQRESAEEHPLLEAELELSQFRTGQHSPDLAGRATEALARLYLRKGLLEDAAHCYRKLGGEYAKIVIRDGKTGRQIYEDDAATDKRLLPYLDEPAPMGSVRLKADKVGGDYQKRMPGGAQLFQFEHRGEDLPFFRHHLVGLEMGSSEFKLFDRTVADDNNAPKEVWSQKLKPTMFQLLSNQALGQANNFNGRIVNPNQFNQRHDARFPYRTVGHLIVLPLGHRVFGIDPVNRRVLWQKDLTEGDTGPYSVNTKSPNGPQPQQPVPLVDPRDGTSLFAYGNNWAQRLGQVGPLEGQAVCVQTYKDLTALDPLNGRTLWTRSMEGSSRNYLFSDANHIFVVEMGKDNTPSGSRVLRAVDGSSVPAPDFTALFAKRVQVFGRHILVAEGGADNKVVLRLYDALTGLDAWKQSYPARSLVARSEDAHFTAVVEPDGKVRVVDLQARKEVMAGQFEEPAVHLRNVQSIHLLMDREYFYIACQAPLQVNPNLSGMAASNVRTDLGMRTVPVNGRLYCFERATGDVNWHTEVKDQFLVLDQFRELPIVLLTARHGMNNRPGLWPAEILSFEKKTGRNLFGDKEGADLRNNRHNFFGVQVDARSGTVDFLSADVKLTHSPGLKPKKDQEGKPAAAPAPRPQPIRGRIDRPALDRVRIREVGNPLPPR